jgi:acetate kinase
MAYTFIINPGSTSRKYALAEDGDIIYTAHAARDDVGVMSINTTYKNESSTIDSDDVDQSMGHVLEDILSRGLVPDLVHIETILMRVVAPESEFARHRVIDDIYISALQAYSARAPLHIPPLLSEIEAVRDFFPDSVHYAISDSAFHATIGEHLELLSVNAADAQQYDIHRFGYHGISASSVVRQLEAQDVALDNTVVVHFGGGISVHAIHGGESMNTSMGYDPASGITMSSRGGDITAGAMLALASAKGMDIAEAQEYLYTQCGFQGVVGESDMRRVLEQYKAGDDQAMLLVAKLRYEIQSWVASHAFMMGGISQLVLTGTALYRNPVLRALVLEGLDAQGMQLDESANQSLESQAGVISTSDSAVTIRVAAADEAAEMLAIYQEEIVGQ